jgi:hypothetical protein
MVIDSSGNVGIGTTSPAGLLHVKSTGTTRCFIEGNDGKSEIRTSNGTLSFFTNQDANVNGANRTVFYRNGANESMRIDESGNVGIGTSSPSEKLEVSGSAKASGGYFFGSTSSYLYEGAADAVNLRVGSDGPFVEFIDAGSNVLEFGNASGQLALTTSGTERLRIDSSGNVGIGTSSPGYKLDVLGGAENTFIRVRPNSTATDTAGILFGDAGDATSGQIRYSNANNSLRLWTDNSEKLRITSDGNVGIGRSSVSKNLDILGTTAATIRLLSNQPDGTASSTVFSIGDNGKTNEPGALRYAVTVGGEASLGLSALGTSGADRQLTILDSGNVGIGTSSPGSRLHVSESGATDGILLTLDNVLNAAGTEAGLRIRQNSTDLLECNLLTDRAGLNAGVDFKIELSDSAGAVTERFRITESGNVGIGTSSPDELLEVVGSSAPSIKVRGTGNNTPKLIFDTDRGAGLPTGRIQGLWNGTGVTRIDFELGDDGVNKDNGEITFGTSAANNNVVERMRIRSNGVINFANCPTYADDTAAGTGGLVAGDVYKTSTGELRIKL